MPPRHVLTVLAVSDLPRTRAFYAAAFAFPEAVVTPVYVELALPAGQRLGLYERNGFGKNVGGPPHLVPDGALAPAELYFHVDSAAELADGLTRLLAAGARLLSPAQERPWGDEAAYVADPDGTVLVLARPLSKV